MKKIFTLLTIILITTIALCSCSIAKSEKLAKTPTNISIQADQHQVTLNSFWNEYNKRNSNNVYFSEDELKRLGEMNLEFKNNSEPPIAVADDGEMLYYPVFIKSSLFFVDEYGVLQDYLDDTFISNFVHVGETLEGSKLMGSPWGDIYYIQSTGQIQYWSCGNLVKEFKVPANSIYAGHGYWMGYIFRDGDQIYSVMTENNKDADVKLIANNVKQVISADYYFSSDSWSQPLFLMEDGTVKAYISWCGDENDPDDLNHLCSIEKDGGYVRTYYPCKENR